MGDVPWIILGAVGGTKTAARYSGGQMTAVAVSLPPLYGSAGLAVNKSIDGRIVVWHRPRSVMQVAIFFPCAEFWRATTMRIGTCVDFRRVFVMQIMQFMQGLCS